jgi:hypothetical protein
MRRAASDPATLTLSFCFYYDLGALSSFSHLLGPIYRTLEGWGTWPLLYSHFVFLRLGVPGIICSF